MGFRVYRVWGFRVYRVYRVYGACRVYRGLGYRAYKAYRAYRVYRVKRLGFAQRPLSSSLWYGLYLFRILYCNPKKELLRGLGVWVEGFGSRASSFSVPGRVQALPIGS